MKTTINFLAISVLVFGLFTSSCKKDNPIGSSLLENKLISGSGSVSFQRIIRLNYNTRFSSIKQTTDSGYIICGSVEDVNSKNRILLLRLDAGGNIVWKKTFAGDRDEAGIYVDNTSDGGFIILGHSYHEGSNSYNGSGQRPPGSTPILVKTDKDGKQLWQNSYDISFLVNPVKVFETPNGFLMATNNYEEGNAMFLFIDATGSLLKGKDMKWIRSISDIKQSKNGDFIFMGGDYSKCLSRVNSSGDSIWTKIFRDSIINTSSILTESSSGKIYLCGPGTESSRQAFVSGLDSKGNVLTVTRFSNLGLNDFDYLMSTENDEFVASGGASGKIYFIRFDKSGIILWNKIFPNGSSFNSTEVIQTRDKGFAQICTSVLSANGADRYYGSIIKTDAYGN